MSKADPWGEDLQLALYLLYEVHDRGFDGVDDVRAWGPALLRLRRSMETRVLQALRAELPDATRPGRSRKPSSRSSSHAWVIPRFTGPGHAQLFADLWSPPVVLAWTTRRRRCSRPST
ncbi:hypothetical protein ACFY7Y_35725 [Streptomyces virginiae]|uniref:hypothetical protein n=1 Tax=Streptomyces virginiae TaxID=1961 RepID=UPI0036C9F4CF